VLKFLTSRFLLRVWSGLSLLVVKVAVLKPRRPLVGRRRKSNWHITRAGIPI